MKPRHLHRQIDWLEALDGLEVLWEVLDAVGRVLAQALFALFTH